MSDIALTHDTVSLQFTVEELIISNTVKISLTISKIVAEGTKFDLLATLKEVYNADWQVLNLTHGVDSGLDRIYATASCRIPDIDVSMVNRNIKALSVSGLEMKLEGLDNTPPRNKIDQVKQELRKRIYQLADSEVDTLNETLGKEKGWRVGGIEFLRGNETAMMASASYANASHASMRQAGFDDNADEQGTEVTYKVSVSASVKLTRTLHFK